MPYQTVDAAFVLDNLDTMPIIDVRPRTLYDVSRIPGAKSVEMMAAQALGGDVAAEMARRVQALSIGPHDAGIGRLQQPVLLHRQLHRLDNRPLAPHRAITRRGCRLTTRRTGRNGFRCAPL